MKTRKRFECGNNWSVEISKPYKMTLQVSIYNGSYEWADYFSLEEYRAGIHMLYITEMKSNYDNHGLISNYKPKPKT